MLGGGRLDIALIVFFGFIYHHVVMDTVSIVVHTLALTVVDSGYVKMRLLNAVTSSIALSRVDMQFLGSFSLKNNILTCIRSRNAEGLSDYYI